MPDMFDGWRDGLGVGNLHLMVSEPSHEEQTCERCGTPVSIGSGCIDCKPCNHEYNPGAEECDRCEFADECIVPRHFPG